MLKKVVVLLVVAGLLTFSFGCAYNTSNISPTSNWRRVTIAGEGTRMLVDDIDWFLGLDKYPAMDRYLH